MTDLYSVDVGSIPTRGSKSSLTCWFYRDVAQSGQSGRFGTVRSEVRVLVSRHIGC